MYDEYKKFMDEYIRLSHMREVTSGTMLSQGSPTFYLPHHAVQNETSSTTKFRVVFDGSCKTTTGLSLNDALKVGPTLQEDLFSILARFRTFKIALTADIAKMYRQVLVDSTQTPLQRIFWREAPDEPIKTFELLTVTYGTSSASFLAIRALRKLAEDSAEYYPRASRIALRDFYVDDLVTGADSIDEALAIKQEITALLQDGRFELRKWASNALTFEDQGSREPREFALSSDKSSEKKALGIAWDCQDDVFKYSSINNLPPLETPTKRSILSRISLIFDPLGLLGPVILLAKSIMQDLWRFQLEWDESIPLELHTKWRRFEVELQELLGIRIPRLVTTTEEYTSLELHGFSDASEIAYGACIYLRSTSINGAHRTHLLCSKSRVAPLKSLSLPRLELCGAVLLARLLDKVSKCLACPIASTYLWTDSTIVLAWLQSCSRAWSTFVANRIGEIQELTSIQQWNHVPSQDNPADPLSRGVMPASLAQLEIWWSGPAWLGRDRERWPQRALPTDVANVPERKLKAIIALSAGAQEPDLFLRYSSFNKLTRVFAYMTRFIESSKGSRDSSDRSQEGSSVRNKDIPPISLEEQQQAICRLIKLIQTRHFPSEVKALGDHKDVPKSSAILKLNPFLDDAGILRVGGRLRESSLPYASKHPMLLPGNHPFSRLIVIYEHERHFHAGPQATLAAVRECYWLTSARNVIRRILRRCIVCFKSSPKLASAIMGNLPEPRVKMPSKIFAQCGVDYAGPLYYKEGARRSTKLIKCYIAIFICLATKAIHIELASDLSSEAFLNVFRRFVARRGLPSDIFSDNGLNFVGAERELSELRALLCSESTQQHILDRITGVKWHFIPPRAPHHGGLWEAAVKATKRHLARITRNSSLKREELETLLIQIEAILNSRPITPLSDDPNDFVSLTPGHFLVGTPLTAYPEPSLDEVPVNRLSRWQHIQLLRQHFWSRWSREYLHQCQERNKWQTNEPSVHIGQMVIIKEDNTPPLSWPLGRIQEIHPGKDTVARVVTVRTAKGSYKRPITRICLLPIEGQDLVCNL